jgi:AMP nucleosidase
MRTGTVASVDNRNWEIVDPAIIRRLSQSRAIALDMESAAIAANGFHFRVPLRHPALRLGQAASP